MPINPRRARLHVQELETKATPTAQLLVDINQTIDISTGSSPRNAVVMGSTAFFTAGDPLHGSELWKTNGTAAGTVLVKDIETGPASSEPSYLTVMNGVVYFTVRVGNQRELWKSDGTSNGTVLVKGLGTADFNVSPERKQLVAVGNTLFFTADVGTTGWELWKSDGTTAGTVMVKNIQPEVSIYSSSSPAYLRDVNGTLFFTAFDHTAGYRLWKSDGSEAGTTPIASLGFGSSFAALNNKLVFSSTEAGSGEELWISDGTAAGTQMLKDINAGTGSSDPTNFAVIGSTLYFCASDTDTGAELWKSDGTTAGTIQVKDINTGNYSSTPTQLTNVNGTVYFIATTEDEGGELWKSDGTSGGTTLVKDIRAGDYSSYALTLTNINGTLYFAADDGTTDGPELWKSDGTTGGTTLVKDIAPSGYYAYAYLYQIFAVNGTILFGVDDGVHGQELWKTNGTEAGTQLFKDISQRPAGSYVRDAVTFQGQTYFVANNGTQGSELWRSDGTVAGTALFADLTAGADSRYPSDLTVVGNTLFFTMNAAGSDAVELWKSNGTVAGTSLVTTIQAAGLTGGMGNYIDMRDVNGTLFFTAKSTMSGVELWKSDGTAAGTTMVKDIRPGTASSYPTFRASIGNTLYFTASDGTTGIELWKTDGTTAGTVLVKDINPNSADSSIQYVTIFNGQLYFSARTAANGYELWKSDGSEAGTVIVKDIATGSPGSFPRELTVMNNTLYFSARGSTAQGEELWKSDGTEAGTVLLKEINSNTDEGSNPRSFKAINNTLYFVADDETRLGGLWKTDGTESGTVLVKHLINNQTYTYFEPQQLTNVNGTLYYTANDGVHGRELWKSDGTTAGTVLVADIAEGVADSYPSLLGSVNGNLLLEANDFIHGWELWVATNAAQPNQAPTDISLTSNTVAENQVTGVAVGQFNTIDPNSGDTFTYALIDNAGFPDNTAFTIVGNELRSNLIFDFEADASYTIRVRSTDNGGLSTQKTFNIIITNANDEPTNIALSDANVAEAQPAGTVVGLLSTTDEDASETFTYSLFDTANFPDNTSFAIVGNELRTDVVLDQLTQGTYSIRVQSMDSGGLTVQKVFTITVIGDENPPTLDNEPSIVLPMVRKNSTKHLGTSLFPLLMYADDIETPDTLGISVTGFRGVAGTWQHGTSSAGPWATITATEATPMTIPHGSFVRFLPARNVVGFAGLNYNAWDGGLTSDASEVAWVPVNVSSPKYNADGEALMRGTTEDALNPAGTVVSSLVGYLATEFAARTKLGLAITAVDGDGTWQVRVGRTWQPIGAVSATNARLLKSTDQIRFVPNQHWNGFATIEYHAWKQPALAPFPTHGNINTEPANYSVASATGSLTVAAVNDAPTIDISIPRVFDTDPRSVASLITGTADLDGSVKGIAITLASGKNGRWEYRLNNTAAFLPVGSVSTRAALLLDVNAELRFVPNAGSTTAQGTLDYKAWDNSTSYISGTKKRISGTGFSVKVERATFSLGNNAPTFKAGNAPTINQKLALVTAKRASIVVSSLLGLVQDDRGALKGLALTGTTGTGTWEYSLDGGRTWQAVGDVSTNKLLLRSTDRVRYVSASNAAESPTLTFLAWDQTTGAGGDRIDFDNDSLSTTSLTATVNIA